MREMMRDWQLIVNWLPVWRLTDGSRCGNLAFMTDRPPNRIRELREAKGMTQEQLGALIGTDKTVISKLESGRTRLSQARMMAIAASLGCGVAELLEPVAPSVPGWGDDASVEVAEVDIYGDRRGGFLASHQGWPQGFREDETIAQWRFPAAYLSAELQVRAAAVRIVEVRGDGMEPTLMPGDRVMVNLADQSPSPPGVFALWDGQGVVIKRLELIMGSHPPLVEIRSDNPHHRVYERAAADIDIIGRVVWVGRRL
ncbi:LexA family transcriptional regulator [Nitrospirillum sp. BR 11828]|uniref:XRE family transcriptional regulator n=1 Tax=Nitrospirillum sp. BR 11828 TaxID=3104325 RepID=UPI002ACA1C8F|nr:LexA family transcriptional regulator [Nitrospirillum sp. BR 11828]MDZ5650258.1 LexA family transcriptional regulator [Nitrospirillum sp. BR 11828]